MWANTNQQKLFCTNLLLTFKTIARLGLAVLAISSCDSSSIHGRSVRDRRVLQLKRVCIEYNTYETRHRTQSAEYSAQNAIHRIQYKKYKAYSNNSSNTIHIINGKELGAILQLLYYMHCSLCFIFFLLYYIPSSLYIVFNLD